MCFLVVKKYKLANAGLCKIPDNLEQIGSLETKFSHFNRSLKQAEAEVVPSSSLVEMNRH